VQVLQAMRAARSTIFAQKTGWMVPTLMCHSQRREPRLELAEQMRMKEEEELVRKTVKHQDKVMAALAASCAYTLEMSGAH
jgi:hypothetical protein